jgi:hypothetical protein
MYSGGIHHAASRLPRAVTADGYKPVEQSAVIDLGPTELAQQIDWP